MKESKNIEEKKLLVQENSTLVRRMSNILVDSAYSGPPLFFHHKSMKKIQHCCQNLNLFPFLLYSLKNSKSFPLSKIINFFFDIFKNILQLILVIYKSIMLSSFRLYEIVNNKLILWTTPIMRVGKLPQTALLLFKMSYGKVSMLKHEGDVRENILPGIPKTKSETSFLLVIAVYLIPLFLVIQLIGLGCLLLFDKRTPGFIFLVTSLLFLGYITMKIMCHCKIRVRKSKIVKKKKIN